MIIDINKYKNSLADLWHNVFGDDYLYINRIFEDKYRKDILCFGEIDNETVVSAFYLLRNTLRFEDCVYNGYYLYSAATLPACRKRGLMGRLLSEAQAYCKENGVDFISLVPANDGLYGYYSKFGFKEAMHYWISTVGGCDTVAADSESISEIKNIRSVRSAYKGNFIQLADSAFDYAVSCVNNGTNSFYSVSASAYFWYDAQDEIVRELICDDSEKEAAVAALRCFANAPSFDVISPCCLSEKASQHRFGMLYPINTDLIREWKFTDIYMNFALD